MLSISNSSVINGKAGVLDPQIVEVKSWLFAPLLQTAKTLEDQRCPQITISVHGVHKQNGAS